MAPSLFMHDLDRNLYETLCSMPKYQQLFAAYNSEVDERAAKLNLLSSDVRLSDKQMPEIYQLLPPMILSIVLRKISFKHNRLGYGLPG